MKWLAWICVLVFVLVGSQTHAQLFAKKKRVKQPQFNEHIDFEGMVMRYLGKDMPRQSGIEGIYSVSAIVTRRGGFLSSPNRDKVVARRDNYAKVVILKEWPGSKREYLEISLASKDPGKYPVVGEFNSMAEGAGFVYKHYEPNTEGVNYTMVVTNADILDGVRVHLIKRKTITTKLSYLKLYPKKEDLVTNR
ncbi:MAG: hypothetical protein AB7K37_16060 [Cyclobacteriaceae bacterium]